MCCALCDNCAAEDALYLAWIRLGCCQLRLDGREGLGRSTEEKEEEEEQ